MSFKIWFRAAATAVLSLALTTTIALAEDHGHDKHGDDDRDEPDHGHGHGHGHGHDHGHDQDKGRGHDHDRYDDHDRDAARDWYRAHHSHLPPGLAKRDRLSPALEQQLVVRGTLPPGLRRQMQPCPHELEAMFPPPPPNYAHVVIGGNVVLVNRLNFQIADVMHLEVNF